MADGVAAFGIQNIENVAVLCFNCCCNSTNFPFGGSSLSFSVRFDTQDKGAQNGKAERFPVFLCAQSQRFCCITVLLNQQPPPIQTVTSAQCQITSLPTNLHLSLSITGLGLRGSDEGPA